jgi:DNA repair protein SbcC/Rad50
MIQEIHIENFQSHKDTTLKLHPGVNVITGTSDSGKSAIIRALRWVVWNKPSGDSFRSNWGGDTEVSVKLKDYHPKLDKWYPLSVKRIKSNNNEYWLNKDGVKSLFEAFKTDIPEEVKQVLNLNEVNIQQQLDSPFLLTDSSGAVASHFNKIAKLDKIDKTREGIESELRRLKGKKKSKEEDLIKFEKKLNSYPNLDLIEIELEELEELENKRNLVSNAKKRLASVVVKIDAVEDEISEESKLLKFEKDVDRILGRVEKKRNLKDKILMLNKLITDIENINFKLGKFSKIVNLQNSVTNLLQIIADKHIFLQRQALLSTQLNKLLTVNKKLLKTQENALQLEQQFAKEFPAVCPLCGTPKKDIKL